MKQILITTLALLALLSNNATPAGAQTLSLEQCREQAIAHNKSLSAAKLKQEQTTFDMKSYKANFFPQINLMALDLYSTAKGNFTITGGHLPIYNYVAAAGKFVPNVTVNADGSYSLNQYADFPDQTLDWKVKNIFTAGITLMQPLYAGGKISTAYKMSKLGVQMAQENIRLSQSEVLVQTDEAYYLAVQAKELGQVARSYRTLLAELKKNVEAAYAHGMSTRNDIMKVQVKLNEADLNIQKADNGYRLALMNLCHIIGQPLTASIDVDSTLTSVTLTDEDSTTITDRPEYAILDSKTELARQQVKLTRSDYLPNVMLGAAYNYANGGELAGKKLLNDGAATAGVAVTIPLNVFGGATNKVRSARAAYQIAQLEQQDLNEKMQLELAQCHNLVAEAETEVLLCQTALDQAAENMRLSKQQYDVGLETLSDHLETQALWQQSSANLVNARCQLQLARTKLLKASGQL